MAGKFIVFEGGEGSGKTTQVRLLAENLQKRGFCVLLTHEPGSKHSEITPILRRLILEKRPAKTTELFLYLADRTEHVEKVIKPALKKGKIIISDRFDGSTFAYQGYGRGLDLEFIEIANEFAKGGIEPDLYILLDIDPQLGLARRYQDSKKLTRFDKEDLAFHQKVNGGFRRLAQSNPEKWVIVDGSKSVEEIHKQILDILTKKLKLKLKTRA